MSYDLQFRSSDSNLKIGAKNIASYFQQRKNYQVTDKQAFYQNPVTGVYFIFDLIAEETEEQPNLLPISLHLNYYRPHIFGLEAELEVRGLVETFNLLVSDPQIDGMGEGVYSTEKFLSGWNKGNEVGYRAILQQHPKELPPTLPTAEIERCWRWNFAQPDLQQKLGDNIFVPKFIFMLRNGNAVPTVVWPDGIPSAIPEAEMVFIPRKTILSKTFFSPSEDQVIAHWRDVNSIFERFPLEQGALPYRLLQYSATPDTVVSQVRNLKATKDKPTGLSVDKILNADLMAKAMGR